MENLEKFIHENRESFDTEVPGLHVWANIDREMDAQAAPRIVWMRRLKVAAAVAALVVVSCIIGFKMGSSAAEAKSLADISPEYADMEKYFNREINEKMARLASYQQDGFVRPDIQELDAVYEGLKKELEQAPTGEEDKVVQAMINNYQMKIDILEHVLDKVQTTEQTNLKTEENEVSL